MSGWGSYLETSYRRFEDTAIVVLLHYVGINISTTNRNFCLCRRGDDWAAARLPNYDSAFDFAMRPADMDNDASIASSIAGGF